MHNRYDVRQEPDGSWTIYDKFTGWPGEFDGVRMVGMREWDARELVVLVNWGDLRTREAKGLP
jgi:hypothetical protein